MGHSFTREQRAKARADQRPLFMLVYDGRHALRRLLDTGGVTPDHQEAIEALFEMRRIAKEIAREQRR